MTLDPQTMPLLEVAVLHARDAEAAARGEADRLLLLTSPAEGGRAPDPSAVSAVVRETDLPVRVLLRDEHSLEADPAALTRSVELARTCSELGAEGFSFGFLDHDLEVDRAACSRVAAAINGAPWSFHRGFDAALDAGRAWRDALTLPGLDGIATAGSTRGMAAGGEEVVARARRDPRAAAAVLACGDLETEMVPWLVRAGVRQFALGAEARPGGSWTRAYVDAATVRAWRLLLDDAHQRALGVAVD